MSTSGDQPISDVVVFHSASDRDLAIRLFESGETAPSVQFRLVDPGQPLSQVNTENLSSTAAVAVFVGGGEAETMDELAELLEGSGHRVFRFRVEGSQNARQAVHGDVMRHLRQRSASSVHTKVVEITPVPAPEPQSPVRRLPGSAAPIAGGPVGATAALAQLTQGHMLYNPPEEMVAGETARVEVRIAPGAVEAALRENLQGSGVPRVEEITTTTRMTVVLTSSEPARMVVTSVSPPTQFVDGPSPAHWDFFLVATASGQYALRLSVSSVLDLGGDQVPYSPPVIERMVKVTVAPVFSLRQWWSRHWKWAVGTLVAASAAVAALVNALS